MVMKHILVTGGTGFLGGRTIEMLLERNYKVRFTGRNAAAARRLEEAGAKFFQLDLVSESAALSDAFTGVDAVIHCAALSAPWGRYSEFHAANVSATNNVCTAALKAAVSRCVHVSTSSVYFDFRHRLDIKESDPLPQRQSSYYSQTKLQAESVIRHHSARGLEAVLIRPRGIFGPGDTAILGRLLRANNESGIPLINGGKFLMDITYIDNVAAALISALSVTLPDAPSHATFNITNGEPRVFRQLLEELSSAMSFRLSLRPISYAAAHLLASGLEAVATIRQKEPVFTRYTLGLLSFSQTLNIEKSRQYLNYAPSISIEEGLSRCAQFQRDQAKIGRPALSGETIA